MSQSDCKKVIVGNIKDPTYDRASGAIRILLTVSNDVMQVAAINKRAVIFRGLRHDQIAPQDVDTEMESTAELLRRARGLRIRLSAGLAFNTQDSPL